MWWQAGAQPIQLMKDNEVQFAAVWSGRAVGEPGISYTYREGVLNLSYFVVPKGANPAEKAAAMKLAGEIAECSPLGLLSTRATMRAGLADRVMAATNHELAEQTRLRATEDFKEGVKATEERRVANFKGR